MNEEEAAPSRHQAVLMWWLKIIGTGCAAIIGLVGVASLVMTVGGYFTKVNNHEAAITELIRRADEIKAAMPFHELDKRLFAIETVLKLNSSSSPVAALPIARPTAGKQR